MHLLQAPNVLVRGCKNVYQRVAHRKSHEEPSVPPLFDSGMSAWGDWVLDLAALALVAIVVGTIAEWAYVTLFQK
jgi:hypothetical protein